MTGTERTRMADAGHPENGWHEASPWYEWGPYLAERAWGGVREDYSADGDAWNSFPHDHARSRAYRWNEDGMAGMTDVFNRLTLALSLWNGVDPILKERMFGLSGPEGNHGEDVKDYWWYLDAVPSSAWLKWRYHYPQAAFPYEDLVTTNAARSKFEREYELIDTGVFDDDRYWIVEVDYAKESPTDIAMRITVRNRGADEATLHVLPTLWFRNEWSWNPDGGKPGLSAGAGGRSVLATHPELGDYTLEVGPGPDGTQPTLLFCENETNLERIDGTPSLTPYPKDGINDHVVGGAATVNPAGVGTKASAWYQLTVPAGGTAELRLRLHKQTAAAKPSATPSSKASDLLGASFAKLMKTRQAEADEFYEDLRRKGGTDEEQLVMRQAFAGMLWSKQYYGYNVARWLDGDPGLPPPPPERKTARNAAWRHFDAADILSMPDPWEYPWFAAWDLGFHAVTLAHIDPTFAKYQLLLMCREWFQHPNGALPAYEWSFDDVNPPVHAAAAYLVWIIDGKRDTDFLKRIFNKLLLNFTWWLNREDQEGNDLFSGGFLGLDNIGAFDRSHLPAGAELEQSDATAWMFMYCLSMLRIATALAETDPAYEDFETTFLEHAVRIGAAMNRSGLWDPEDGFFYDALKLADGSSVPIKVHSMVGVIPLLPTAIIPPHIVARGQSLGKRFARFMEGMQISQELLREGGFVTGRPGHESRQISVVPPVRLGRLLTEMLAEDGFLSPHGLRALSQRHRDAPFELELGGLTAKVDYEPGELTSALFGGNSNWRGPVWMPTNYLVIVSLRNWDGFMGEDFKVDYPTGSGNSVRLSDVSADISRRLISIWLPDEDGRRPVFGAYEKFQTDPDWHDLLWFHEYFHGDTGAGIGASHQTGWTGLVAHLICRGGMLDMIEAAREPTEISRREVRVDAETLSRVQFALTASFHFIFPPLSMGLGLMLVVIGVIYVRTKDPKWRQLSFFWVKVYGLIFAVGVATGVVQEFEFGMNWADYSRFVGNVFGSLLAAEGVFAFFLEGGFLGLMLFGGNRLGPRLWLFSIFMVVFGAHFSALWILMANSWMQTPQGYEIVNNRAVMTDFWQVVFTPSFIPRLLHVWVASWTVGAALMLSVSAWYLLKKRHVELAKSNMRVALPVFILFATTNVFVFGANMAIEVTQQQPLKLASMEGLYQSESCARMFVVGWVDETTQTTSGISIPCLLSFLAYQDIHATVQGIDSFAPDPTPPINLVFQVYHFMITVGPALAAIGVLAGLMFLWRRRLFESRFVLWLLVLTVFLGEATITAGWWTAEIGRQPWVVYDVLKTADGVSPVLAATDVVISLGMFVLLYSLLLVLFLYLMNRKIQDGPEELEAVETVSVSTLPDTFRDVFSRRNRAADLGEEKP